MKIEKYVFVIITILFIVFGTYRLITWMNFSIEESYELEEIESGTYVIKYDSVSTVPANNFTCAEYCVDSSIYQIKGSVSIKYISEDPYVEVKTYPHINCNDSAIFYIPKGSVVTNASVGTGRR